MSADILWRLLVDHTPDDFEPGTVTDEARVGCRCGWSGYGHNDGDALDGHTLHLAEQIERLVRSERADEQLRTAVELVNAAHAAADEYDGRTTPGRAALHVARSVARRVETQRPGPRPVARWKR